MLFLPTTAQAAIVAQIVTLALEAGIPPSLLSTEDPWAVYKADRAWLNDQVDSARRKYVDLWATALRLAEKVA